MKYYNVKIKGLLDVKAYANSKGHAALKALRILNDQSEQAHAMKDLKITVTVASQY